MRRAWLWGALALVLLGAGLWILLPRILGSDLSRHRLEKILSDALGRTVTIESLQVETDRPRVVLRGVTVAQPQALAVPEQGPLLHADEVQLEVEIEELLDERVVGLASATGVTLTVLERGGRTSLHDLGRRPADDEPAAEREERRLALDVELHEVALRFVDLDRSEALELREVAVRGHLGQDGEASREAIATLSAAAVQVRDIELHELLVQARLRDAAVQLVRLHAKVGEQGTLEGHGWLGAPEDARSEDASASRDWSASLTLHDAALDGPLRDAVALGVPWLVRATGSEGQATTGWLSAEVAVAGTGLRWETIEPSLHGTAALALREVVVPADAMLLQLADLAGREPGPWTLPEATAEVSVADGWLHPGAIAIGELRPGLRGRVSLRGQLDLTVDLMPLVELYGGGSYAAVARTTTSLPVRVTGTIDEPELAPPRVRDVAAGLLGGALRRALDDDE